MQHRRRFRDSGVAFPQSRRARGLAAALGLGVALGLSAVFPGPEADAGVPGPDPRPEPEAGAGAEVERTSLDGAEHPVVLELDAPRPVARTDAGTVLAGASPLEASFVGTNEDPEGDMPREVAFLPDGTACVIANRDTDTVTFFDVATRTITDTVATGDFPVDVAVTPDGRYALMPNVFSDDVTVIDLATRTVAATIPITGTQPFGIRVASDSSFAAVSVINDAVTSAFSILDLDTLTEVRSIPTVSQGVLGFFFTPEPGISGNLFSRFALAPDDATLVLPDRGGSRVVLYDAGTGAQIAAIPTAGFPTSVDVAPDGTFAVVGHESNVQTVSVIDLVVPGLTVSHAIGQNLVNQVIRVTPDGAHALAAIQNAVVFVDLATGAVTSTISTGTVGDIELSFDGQYAFVSNFNARVLDVATQSLVRTIPFAACVDAATSPTELRAVALNNRFREDVHLYDISGAAGFFEGKALSGEVEEGDATRSVAIAPGGAVAVAVHNTSDNAAILDVGSGTVRGYVPTGERSLGVAITPDGTTAVVANFNSDTVSVIDLTTDQTVATLAVADGPTEVAISPDGRQAFVSTVAGTDRLHFIDLDGPSSSVTGSAITGQMGSILYTYGVFSDVAVSPDGSLVAVCISFDDQLLLLDAATRAEVARVPVGDFPIRVAFAPDGSRAYVSHSFSDDLYVVDIDGGSSSVAAVVPGIEFPLDVRIDAEGGFVYVASFDLSSPRVAVVSAATDTLVANVALGDRPRSLAMAEPDGVLYATQVDGTLAAIDAAGPASAVLETIALSAGPSNLAFDPVTHTAVIAQPIPDGVDVIGLRDELDCRRGNLNATNGVTADVVLVAGSAGSPFDRTVELGPSDPFTIDVLAPPSDPDGPARFALYAWVGEPDPTTVRVLPFDLGTSCMVMPPNSDPKRPQDDPKKIWNNLGREGFLGTPNLPSTPAPVLGLVTKPGGVGRVITAYVQGLMLDGAAPQGQAGATNGVRIDIR